MSAAGTPTLPVAQTFLDKVLSFVGQITSTVGTASPDNVSLGLSLAQTAVSVFAPEATIAGFAISKAIALAGDLWAQVPTAVSAVNAVKAAVDGGAAPTADQWAAVDAAADAAHAKLQGTA